MPVGLGHRHRPAGRQRGRGPARASRCRLPAAAETITVPDVSGQNEEPGEAEPEERGLHQHQPRRHRGWNGEASQHRGGTDPPAGSEAAPDDEIVLLVVGG